MCGVEGIGSLVKDSRCKSSMHGIVGPRAACIKYKVLGSSVKGHKHGVIGPAILSERQLT